MNIGRNSTIFMETKSRRQQKNNHQSRKRIQIIRTVLIADFLFNSTCVSEEQFS